MACRACRSIAAAIDLDIEVADLLAQGIAVDAQKVGSADRVAARRRQRRRQQRILDFTQDAMVEPRWRQSVLEAGKVSREMAFNRRAQIIVAASLLAAGRK